MAGKNVTSVADAQKARADEPGARQRSTIGFPYTDLEAAVEIAQAIHNHVGAGNCDDDQLAAWTGQSARSSGYRVQLYAARLFGVIETVGGTHKLTALGKKIVDPERQREARADAFLRVPLFKAVFEKYKGGVIPPAAALARDMGELGVAEKMKDRARRTFSSSAEQAGFFEQGKNRLVKPGVANRSDEEDQEKSNIFDLIYEGGGGIEIRAATAQRSPRPGE
jgi:hypothetical protein